MKVFKIFHTSGEYVMVAANDMAEAISVHNEDFDKDDISETKPEIIQIPQNSWAEIALGNEDYNPDEPRSETNWETSTLDVLMSDVSIPCIIGASFS